MVTILGEVRIDVNDTFVGLPECRFGVLIQLYALGPNLLADRSNTWVWEMPVLGEDWQPIQCGLVFEGAVVDPIAKLWW